MVTKITLAKTISTTAIITIRKDAEEMKEKEKIPKKDDNMKPF